VKKIASVEKKLPEAARMIRRGQPQVQKACLSHPRERSAVTPKHPPWRDCLPGGKNSSRPLKLAQPCRGCKAEKGPGRDKSRHAIAALQRAREFDWTDASRPSYDDSRNVRRGQEDAWRRCGIPRRGEMGTGARGAPIPEVGLYVKIKPVQSRKPGSRPNEGHVNSP
jgi:hypothetical protein